MITFQISLNSYLRIRMAPRACVFLVASNQLKSESLPIMVLQVAS